MADQADDVPHQQQRRDQQGRAVDLRIPAIEKYAYCLCLHVKPTTIFIAMFKLIRALLFASILLNTEFSSNDQVNNLAFNSFDDTHKSTAAAVSILTRIIMASASAVAIYSVISGKAALLMPLYAMLLVEFFFALPSFYTRDMDSSFSDEMSDFRNYQASNIMLQSSNQYARYSVLLISTLTMIVKIYFLCVIWKCYRYLRLIELVTPLRISELYPNAPRAGGYSQYPVIRVLGGNNSNEYNPSHTIAPPPYESVVSSMKPPNYEEAIKSSNIFTINNQESSWNNQQTSQTSFPPTNITLDTQVETLPRQPESEDHQQPQSGSINII